MLFGTREEFDYRHCQRCGVLWLEQPPADMSAYYPEEYFTPAGPGDESPARPRGLPGRLRAWLSDEIGAKRLFGGHRLGARIGRRLGAPVAAEIREVRAFVRLTGLRSFGEPILDVGSSPTPSRAARLVRAGFRNVRGIDPWLPRLADYQGVRLRRIALKDVPASEHGSYGLVTFHHSFEHLPDPRGDLIAAARLVRPGGAVVIRTPVMGTWFWERFGTAWWELDPPRHLFVHTRASLEVLAEAAGLALERVEFESSPVEVIASEQIANDIPWRDPRSWDSRPPSPEKSAALQASEALVSQLNAAGRGGRAIFLLRRPHGAAAPAPRRIDTTSASRSAGDRPLAAEVRSR